MELTLLKQEVRNTLNKCTNFGDYGWSDYSEDFGEFNEKIEDIEEEVFADTQLSLEGVLV